MSFFYPSEYQKAIFEWFQSLPHNAAINAVAGSGKSTSLVRGLGYTDPSISRGALFVAFAKDIVESLKPKLPAGLDCRTLHSLGYATLRKSITPQAGKFTIDGYKYKNLTRQMQIPREYGDPKVFKDTLDDLFVKAQATLTPAEPEALLNLADRFGIDEPPCGFEPMAEAVALLMQEGVQIAMKAGIISFSDQVWLPSYLKLQPPTYSLVCVDEAQDLSAAQMALVKGAAKGTGRVIAVGDPRQAIYQFAGAEPDSFYQLSSFFEATQYPLSICYRCPSSVIDRARIIVPQIESAPDAPAGIVDTINEEKFQKMLTSGDMILCRTTAPLVKLCFQLLRRRVNATIKGRDISATLTSTVRQVCKMRGGSWDNFIASLDAYKEHQLYILNEKFNTEGQQDNLRDRCEAIEVCFESFAPRSMEGFISDIESLFSDQRAAITLSTVHRAKGLENPRVFIIRPEKLPLVWKNQTEAQATQEQNLKYVAITRAQSELYFVETEKEEE